MGKEWWKDQWKQIRGHVKFRLLEIVFGSGAIILTATSYILHIMRRFPPWVFPGGVLIVAVMVFWLALRAARGAAKDSPPAEPNVWPETPTSLPALPKPVNLHGVIERLYFTEPSGLIKTYSAVLEMTITNRGTDEAVITRWGLHVYVGADDKLQAESVALGNLTIKKQEQGLVFGDPSFNYESLDTDLTKLSTPYKRGIPQKGWVRFDVWDYGSMPPYNGHFWVVMEDSFGDVHWAERKPQIYKIDGELMENQALAEWRSAAMKSLGGSS